MKRIVLIFLLLTFFVFLYNDSLSCTNFLVTRGASTDGSTFITYAADSHVLYGELYYYPAADHVSGSMRKVYEWDTGKYLGEIKEVLHTYSVVGNMNEHSVAIGETTYGGRSELGSQKGAIIDYGSLIYIALQRSKTARQAIKIMSDLVAEYGYYSSGESFSISDPNEVWIMEMIGKGEGEKGAVWVALRVPDGYVCGHANQARITTFNYQKDNKFDSPDADCFNSVDVISFARKKGWYVGDDRNFSFSDTYAPVDFSAARFCEIRVWSMFKDVNASMEKYFDYAQGNIAKAEKFADGTPNPNHYATNRMPLWIKPDRKISVEDMMDFMRDHLENTPLDMRKDVGAGPFECPYRLRPLTWSVDGVTYCNERATATQQTGFSFVAQSRNWLPANIGGILWWGVDDAASTVYMPMYCSINKTPKAFEVGNGSMMNFTFDSGFWIFNMVSNFAYSRYNEIYPDIREMQVALENDFIARVKDVDVKATEAEKVNPAKAVELLTDFSTSAGDETYKKWKDFYGYLFAKYMDGNIKHTVNGKLIDNGSGVVKSPKQPGYDNATYKRIATETGDKLKVKGQSAH